MNYRHCCLLLRILTRLFAAGCSAEELEFLLRFLHPEASWETLLSFQEVQTNVHLLTDSEGGYEVKVTMVRELDAMLSKASSRESNPSTYFCLPCEHSTVQWSPPSWPLEREFSLSLWIRPTNLVATSGTSDWKPLLSKASFLTIRRNETLASESTGAVLEGASITFWLTDGAIIVTSVDSRGTERSESVECPHVVNGKWVHLTMQWTRQSLKFNKHEIKFWFDKMSVPYTINFPYPKWMSTAPDLYKSFRSSAVKATSQKLDVPEESPPITFSFGDGLIGQIGPIVVWKFLPDLSLHNDVLKTMYEPGKGYQRVLSQKSSVVACFHPKHFVVNAARYTETYPCDSFLTVYSRRSHDGWTAQGLCISGNDVLGTTYFASLHHGATPWRLPTVFFSLQTLGGPLVLAPLIHLQLPQKKEESCGSESKNDWVRLEQKPTPMKTDGGYQPSQHVVSCILRIIGSFLSDTRYTRDYVIHCRFFGVLRCYLEVRFDNDPEALSCPKLLSALLNLANLSAIQQVAQASVWRNLLCSFSLFSAAPIETQKTLFEYVFHTACATPTFFRYWTGSLEFFLESISQWLKKVRHLGQLNNATIEQLTRQALYVIAALVGVPHAVVAVQGRGIGVGTEDDIRKFFSPNRLKSDVVTLLKWVSSAADTVLRSSLLCLLARILGTEVNMVALDAYEKQEAPSANTSQRKTLTGISPFAVFESLSAVMSVDPINYFSFLMFANHSFEPLKAACLRVMFEYIRAQQLFIEMSNQSVFTATMRRLSDAISGSSKRHSADNRSARSNLFNVNGTKQEWCSHLCSSGMLDWIFMCLQSGVGKHVYAVLLSAVYQKDVEIGHGRHGNSSSFVSFAEEASNVVVDGDDPLANIPIFDLIFRLIPCMSEEALAHMLHDTRLVISLSPRQAPHNLRMMTTEVNSWKVSLTRLLSFVQNREYSGKDTVRNLAVQLLVLFLVEDIKQRGTKSTALSEVLGYLKRVGDDSDVEILLETSRCLTDESISPSVGSLSVKEMSTVVSGFQSSIEKKHSLDVLDEIVTRRNSRATSMSSISSDDNSADDIAPTASIGHSQCSDIDMTSLENVVHLNEMSLSMLTQYLDERTELLGEVDNSTAADFIAACCRSLVTSVILRQNAEKSNVALILSFLATFATSVSVVGSNKEKGIDLPTLLAVIVWSLHRTLQDTSSDSAEMVSRTEAFAKATHIFEKLEGVWPDEIKELTFSESLLNLLQMLRLRERSDDTCSDHISKWLSQPAWSPLVPQCLSDLFRSQVANSQYRSRGEPLESLYERQTFELTSQILLTCNSREGLKKTRHNAMQQDLLYPLHSRISSLPSVDKFYRDWCRQIRREQFNYHLNLEEEQRSIKSLSNKFDKSLSQETGVWSLAVPNYLAYAALLCAQGKGESLLQKFYPHNTLDLSTLCQLLCRYGAWKQTDINIVVPISLEITNFRADTVIKCIALTQLGTASSVGMPLPIPLASSCRPLKLSSYVDCEGKKVRFTEDSFATDHSSAGWKPQIAVEHHTKETNTCGVDNQRHRSASMDSASVCNSPRRQRASSAHVICSFSERTRFVEPPAWKKFRLFLRGTSLNTRISRWMKLRKVPNTCRKSENDTNSPVKSSLHNDADLILASEACRVITVVGVADGQLVLRRSSGKSSTKSDGNYQMVFEPVGHKRRKSIERSLLGGFNDDDVSNSQLNIGPSKTEQPEWTGYELQSLSTLMNSERKCWAPSFAASHTLRQTRVDLLTRRRTWPLGLLRRILRRRYMFSKCGLEFFWADGSSTLIVFPRSALAAHDISAANILAAVNANLETDEDNQPKDEIEHSSTCSESASFPSISNDIFRQRSTTMQSSTSVYSTPDIDTQSRNTPVELDSCGIDSGMSTAPFRERRGTLSMPEIMVTNSNANKKEQSGSSVAKAVENLIRELKLPNLRSIEFEKPRYFRELWVKREISNFEYLMQLNFLAGRSYHDLNQYPVFPWVLSNYRAESIDLSDPKNYRDLTKPIPALNPERHQHFMECFEQNEGNDVPPFMHGSHYSRAGLILFFLLRCEPFSSLHVDLQSEKFDIPDRMFHSIEETWKFCYENDTMELIPEFYCMPEFLLNSSKLPLGNRQDGSPVDDVVLPPWASSPVDFVNTMRNALESEYVSHNLANWIDLVFGYKQRGTAAVQARNVFYHLTYENASPPTVSTSNSELASVAMQVREFGQTPSQLFGEPHVCRNSLEKTGLPLFAALEAPGLKILGHQAKRRESGASSRNTDYEGTSASNARRAQRIESRVVAYVAGDIPSLPSRHPVSSSGIEPLEKLRIRNTVIPDDQRTREILEFILLWVHGVPEDAEMSEDSSSKHMLWSLDIRKQLKSVSWGIACVTHLEFHPDKISAVYGDCSVAEHKWQSLEASTDHPFDFRTGKLRSMASPELVTVNSHSLQCAAHCIRALHSLSLTNSGISGDAKCDPGQSPLSGFCKRISQWSSPLGLPWPNEIQRVGHPLSAFVSPVFRKKHLVGKFYIACCFIDGCVKWGELHGVKYDSWDPSECGLGSATCLDASKEHSPDNPNSSNSGSDIIAIGTECGNINVCQLVSASEYHYFEEQSKDSFPMFQLVRTGIRPVCLPYPLDADKTDKRVKLSNSNPEPTVERNGDERTFGSSSGCVLVQLEQLYGHKKPVTSISVEAGLDLIVSGDESGCVLSHSIRKGQLLHRYVVGLTPVNASFPVPHIHYSSGESSRCNYWQQDAQLFPSITHPHVPVKFIQPIGRSKIAVIWQPIVEISHFDCRHTKLVETISVFHINGQLLAQRYKRLFGELSGLDSPTSSLASSSDGSLLVCGTVAGGLIVYDGLSLNVLMSEMMPQIGKPYSVMYNPSSSGNENTGGDRGRPERRTPQRASAHDATSSTSLSGMISPGITFLAFKENDNYLFCGDMAGRIIVLADPVGCQKKMTESLKEGLFSLYG